jgi:hypothetical protein
MKCTKCGEFSIKPVCFYCDEAVFDADVEANAPQEFKARRNKVLNDLDYHAGVAAYLGLPHLGYEVKKLVEKYRGH